MISDRTTLMLLAVFCVVCAIPTALYFRTLPVAGLTASEKELADFSSTSVPVTPIPPRMAFSGVACPVKPAQKPVAHDIGKSTAQTPMPLPAPASPDKSQARTLASLPIVSMISYDESTKMAIIDNRVVSEGSKLDGGVIVKIEQERVLWRKTGRDIWLTIDR
ncbi:MAG: hypothetical protein PHY09_06435 [Desulfuromonadaceae bacterium]|nr:hypothetical protein [Desulfuromonadaceae bacterium]MDD5104083.1 hypothetical protein [Desulfuromonadaceae bacterium]